MLTAHQYLLLHQCFKTVVGSSLFLAKSYWDNLQVVDVEVYIGLQQYAKNIT